MASWLGLLAWANLEPACTGETVVSSAPAGFYRIDLLGNSDTYVSTPYLRPAEAMGMVASISENVLTVQGSPAWQPSQFVYSAGVQPNTYFLLFLSGAKEGFYYPVLGNASNTTTLDLGGGDLLGVLAGDRIAIHPYWTLGTLFPGGEGVHASSSQFIRKTEIFIPNFTGTGINLSPAKTYYYLTNTDGGEWRKYGESGNKDDDVLLPDVYFIVRHNLDISTTLTVRGVVACSKWAIVLATLASGKQDNIIALPRPTDMTLSESGLIESGAFRASTSRFLRTDELFVFDNTLKLKNKSPSATYYYYNNIWQRYPSTENAGGDKPFKPGNAVIIRKASDTTAPTWVNLPNY